MRRTFRPLDVLTDAHNKTRHVKCLGCFVLERECFFFFFSSALQPLCFSLVPPSASAVVVLQGSTQLEMEFIACVVWLLRSELLIQLKTFVFLNLFDLDDDDEEKREKALRERLKGRRELPLFFKLLPYFNGEHHLEDIMWRKNIQRSRLLSLIEAFADVLTTCTHE